MASSDSWPSDVSAPLTANNDNDHSGLIVVLTAVCLCLYIVAIAARVYSSVQKSSLSPDDYTFAALVIAAIIQVTLVFAEVHFGWGTRIESIDTHSKEQMFKVGQRPQIKSIKTKSLMSGQIGYVADIFSVIVLGLSKITVCIFYENLFSQMQRRFIRSLLLGTIIWTLLSVFLVAIRCTSSPWNEISAIQCSGLFPRWEAVTIIDISTEALLLVYVALAIYKVKISTKKKVIVFCALESRMILIPLAAVRIHYIKVQLDSENPTLIGSFATVCTEIYLALSVSCLLTAFLKSFLAVYEDEYGISYTYRGPSKSGSKGTTQSGSRPGLSKSKDSGFHRLSTRGNGAEHQLKGWEREEDPIMDKSDTGRGLHILKTVHLSVEDEPIELSDRGAPSL
ncbi:hypothetical protein N7462_006478 [Penicillium macrosclerotiorum]|uniref:uncharacterized protein n=1 Tax=Penicillium macrosclerotiorum TaxID=303699 RepID=UPI00254831B8|nr:uncharacterized protein N7462_006478 [Penicillium macrosclerotiorum]KAJ5683313.1 hypothetical protein N7462_006478 [Penicillium macrosclerotiorum]